MIGESLGEYRILEPLGAGGMGEVYRALDSNLKREVAIKLLPPEMSRDPERLARLEREAQLLAALNHPGIASIHNLEQAEDRRFLVLELVEGETLAEHLERGALPLQLALEMARQIAQALEAAHEAGIIHRDLKPANVKITPDFKVKVLDFGLAKATDPAPDTPSSELSRSPKMMVEGTQAGVILGTAAYMSPEQARGHALDKRTDIWSFGVVLYEMLTGDSPFSADTLGDSMAGILKEDPDWEQLPPETPVQIRRLLRRCARKNREARLRDIGDARLEIEEAIEQPEARVGTGDAAAAGSHAFGLRFALPILAATAMLAGVTGWAIAPDAPSTSWPTIRLEAEITETMINTSQGSNVVLSPDGARMAYIAQSSWGQPTELHIRSLDESHSTRLAVHAKMPFFSPDGQWVAFWYGPPRESAEAARPSRELRKVSINGGTPQVVASAPGMLGGRGGAWGTDDTIVFGTAGDGLYWVSADGGEPQQLLGLAAGEQSYRWPQLLPGERHLLFTSRAEGLGFDASNVELLDLESGARTVLVSGATYGRYVPTGHLVYVSGDTLYAVSFDLEALEIAGSGVAVVRGVHMFDANGPAQFSFSETGVLVYKSSASAGDRYPVVWVDRRGIRSDPLPFIEPGRYTDPRLSPNGRRLAMTVDDGYEEGQNEIWVHDLARGSKTPIAEYVAVITRLFGRPTGSS